jgi:ubiquitin C-terminal hydrolase
MSEENIQLIEINKTLPTGIPNPSNFCYIIASLQSLFNDTTINDYINKHNNDIDTKLSILFELYDMNTKLQTKEVVENHINEKVKHILGNKNEFNNILKKYDINKVNFLQLTKKIKDNVYHIYIYIHFAKLMNYYKETSNYVTQKVENKEQINIQEQMLQTYKMIMEYIKLNSNVLGAMGITELVDGQQHDAQEYILTLLDILNDSHTFKLVDYLEPEIEKLTEKEMNSLPLNKRIIYGYKKAFAQYNKDGYTPLKTNLYFYTTQFIDCRNCKFKSISYQENSMISLPIPDYNNEDENITIYDCLDKYFGLEVMDYGYKCDECEERVENNILSKKILTTPKSFIVFLKRFNFNMKTMSMTKNHNMVMYPQILNISKYLIAKDEVASYKLKSVICHNGCMSYGHYYSYNCKTISGVERWFKCNDEYINEVPIENFENVVISKQAYMLFYEKV